MKLNLDDARYAAGVFNDYFRNITDIAEYNKQEDADLSKKAPMIIAKLRKLTGDAN